MKAILIDVTQRIIKEVEIDGDNNQQIYALLGEGTELMEGAVRLDDNDIVYVDEEGLMNPKTGAFSFGDTHPFMGNGLVCGGDDEGGSADVKMTIEEVRAKVRFYYVRPRV